MANTAREARDQLLDKARLGDITPEQAERAAEGLGCGPLAFAPPPDDFDPMDEAFWTLPMALAWIAYRTPDAVREWWDEYRAECWDWQPRTWRIGPDGPVRNGHVLEQRPAATLARLTLAETLEDRNGRDPAWSMTVGEATEALLIALRTGCIAATGIATADGTRQEIAALLWQDLDFALDFTVDAIQAKDPAEPGPVFVRVTVQRNAVTTFWPPRRERLVERLPPLMTPQGPGYMPLYCAAQWIASEGGARDFEPEDNEVWRPAYVALIDAISGGEVAISGVARGTREAIDGVVFAGCQVSYPFGTTSLELMFSGTFYLQSYPYSDVESWRDGLGDAFENRWEKRWTQLMVRKDDVARLWPFGVCAPVLDEATIRAGYRSGAPGKPSSMHLVEQEFEARCARGEVEASISREAQVLYEWRLMMHPSSLKLTAKTIRVRIAASFRAYHAAR